MSRASTETLMEVDDEVRRARAKHPRPYGSSHEGYAVLLEEVDELWDEVKNRTDERSYAAMRKEAVQIAAVAIRFIEEVCDPRMPGKQTPPGDS